MKTINHADILMAYLSRMTRADLEHILDREAVWSNACWNGNSQSQNQARAGFYAAICNGVNNLQKHDIQLIEKVLA
jgi:hypothetical protein